MEPNHKLFMEELRWYIKVDLALSFDNPKQMSVALHQEIDHEHWTALNHPENYHRIPTKLVLQESLGVTLHISYFSEVDFAQWALLQKDWSLRAIDSIGLLEVMVIERMICDKATYFTVDGGY